jgi:hypothetical protein
MTSGEKLFSEKVSAGSRTYLFDVKESINGVKYLIITESRENMEETHKNKIIIFQDNLLAFNEGFIKAIEFMFDKTETRTYNIHEIRKRHPKAYTKWTQEEDARLKNQYVQGRTIDELADIFQRKPSAVRSRLQKLGLLKAK